MKKILDLLVHFFSGAGIFALGAGLVVVGMSLNVVAGGYGADNHHGASPVDPATPAVVSTDVAPATELPPPPEPCKKTALPEADALSFEVVGVLVANDGNQLIVDTPMGRIEAVPVANLDTRSEVKEGEEVFVRGEREGGVLIATTIGHPEDRCLTPTPTPSPVRPTRHPTPQPRPHRETVTPAATASPTRRPTASPTVSTPPPPPTDSPTPSETVTDSPEVSPIALIPRLFSCIVDALFRLSEETDCW